MNMSTSTHDLFDFFKKANSNISDEYTRICRKKSRKKDQRNLPAYDKSSDAERRMENTIRINGSFSE